MFMKKAVYPGTFDPLTIGHLDVIKRAARLVEELHVVVANNVRKSPTFTSAERIEMIKKVTKDIDNLVITSTDELVIRYASQHGIDLMIRGLKKHSRLRK
jgi:pantetheine-phosphate adenylyltransferase